MNSAIVLDSTPLGLLVQRPGYRGADECREWFKRHLSQGAKFYVPEIVNYELRRELLRLDKRGSLATLSDFNHAVPGRFLSLTTQAIDLAAELWASARRLGSPSADPHALDVDVILAAQVLVANIAVIDLIVATSNPKHLSHFVTARHWMTV